MKTSSTTIRTLKGYLSSIQGVRARGSTMTVGGFGSKSKMMFSTSSIAIGAGLGSPPS